MKIEMEVVVMVRGTVRGTVWPKPKPPPDDDDKIDDNDDNTQQMQVENNNDDGTYIPQMSLTKFTTLAFSPSDVTFFK